MFPAPDLKDVVEREATTMDRLASCGEYSASEEAIFRSAANSYRALLTDRASM
jgi:hypothetical protein